MTVSAQNLVWIDMEMTGLDPEQNVVLEIAKLSRIHCRTAGIAQGW